MTTMYAKYTYGSVTIGYQVSRSDGPASSNDIDFKAAGITYAITDDFTVGYSTLSQTKLQTLMCKKRQLVLHTLLVV